MLRAYSLRYILVAALFFAFGTVQVGVAATTAFDQQLHRQDVGDDDGDGILNYQDPDDNNDGILDKDTPAPTAVPPVGDLDEDNPDNDSVVDNETNQELTPDTFKITDNGSTIPAAASQVLAPQVASKPNTGTGTNAVGVDYSTASIALILEINKDTERSRVPIFAHFEAARNLRPATKATLSAIY